MKIGIDLDGTISEYPKFFKVFTAAMSQAGSEIYIITDRPPLTESDVKKELDNYGITYDAIKITGQKSDYILRNGINVLFDDVEQYFAELPEKVAVFKIRQKYNFDFVKKCWL